MTATPRLRVLLLACLAALPAWAEELSDDAVRDRIIGDSIAGYSGNCPCPENVDRAGRRCGQRSAWSKPGGDVVLCYRADVSDDMIRRYRKRLE